MSVSTLAEKKELFQTINDVAKKEILYKAIHDADYGSIFTFEQLKVMTGFDIQNNERGVIYEVNKMLLKNDHKLLISVREVGYKIAFGDEQLDHASNRKLRGKRQFVKGKNELENTNVTLLTPEQRIRRTELFNHTVMILQTARKRNIEGIEITKKSIKKQTETGNDITHALKDIEAIKKHLGLE